MQNNNLRQVNFKRINAKIRDHKSAQKEQKFLEGIEKEVTTKTYREENKRVNDTAFYLSYLFNALSVLSAGYAVYSFAMKLFQNKPVAIAVAIAILIAIEQVKRLSSSKFWKALEFQGNFDVSWLGLSVGIFVVSALFSGYGGKAGVTDFSGTPELVASNRLKEEYQAKATEKQKAIDYYKSQKDTKSGMTFIKHSATLKKLETEKAAYEGKIRGINDQLEGKNAADLANHQNDVALSGWTILGFLLICELLFELCVRYNFVYRKNVYIEMKVARFVQEKIAQQIKVTQDMVDIYVFNLMSEMKQSNLRLSINQRPSEYNPAF